MLSGSDHLSTSAADCKYPMLRQAICEKGGSSTVGWAPDNHATKLHVSVVELLRASQGLKNAQFSVMETCSHRFSSVRPGAQESFQIIMIPLVRSLLIG